MAVLSNSIVIKRMILKEENEPDFIDIIALQLTRPGPVEGHSEEGDGMGRARGRSSRVRHEDVGRQAASPARGAHVSSGVLCAGVC